MVEAVCATLGRLPDTKKHLIHGARLEWRIPGRHQQE
jgi:hypothetical protein